MKRSRNGFTLIEICLAVAIALVMLMIAVPSISGVINRQKANQPFDALDQLVKKAHARSLAKHRTYFLGWDKDQIVLRPEKPENGAEAKGIDRILFADNENYELELPAALVKKAPKQWVFWPTGTCEPAVITYKGPSSSWKAIYRPLTVRAEVAEL